LMGASENTGLQRFLIHRILRYCVCPTPARLALLAWRANDSQRTGWVEYLSADSADFRRL
jgi:hypothetical protein